MKIDQNVLAQMLDIIAGLGAEQLALAAKHESDDDAVVPPAGSPGEQFLTAARDDFVSWVRREGRFPTEAEAGDVATEWHRHEAQPSVVAQAYVDLGLYFSGHVNTPYASKDASLHGMCGVLDQAAEQLVVTLAGDYGPQV